MARRLKLLVAESEPKADREARRARVGRSSGETYVDLLRRLAPGAGVDRVRPADLDKAPPDAAALRGYDAVLLTGSPLHLYEPTAEAEREIGFMRAVFASGTPAFGSCAGLQAAAVAAGGRVRAGARPREAGFARRITATAEGRVHPLLRGRPAAWDACAIHGDEVAELPPGATRLAGNSHTTVQAAEIRSGEGVFWGVQYHPELSLHEIAAALRSERAALTHEGLARCEQEVDSYADAIEALDRDASRVDLAWRLGLDAEVIDAERRCVEIRNFLEWVRTRRV